MNIRRWIAHKHNYTRTDSISLSLATIQNPIIRFDSISTCGSGHNDCVVISYTYHAGTSGNFAKDATISNIEDYLVGEIKNMRKRKHNHQYMRPEVTITRGSFDERTPLLTQNCPSGHRGCIFLNKYTITSISVTLQSNITEEAMTKNIRQINHKHLLSNVIVSKIMGYVPQDGALTTCSLNHNNCVDIADNAVEDLVYSDSESSGVV